MVITLRQEINCNGEREGAKGGAGGDGIDADWVWRGEMSRIRKVGTAEREPCQERLGGRCAYGS